MDQIREMHFLFFFQRRETKKKLGAPFFSFLKTGRSAYKMTIPAFETNIVVDLGEEKKKRNGTGHSSCFCRGGAREHELFRDRT